ncbi:hypothetical protein WISP_70828 [Willisornis vidua]|uniref:Uncharacterized protein n=1 Tax=Willisornis vidua TaxID=1566151 RepID=A0ABQ9DDG4_9PASS|nr:hypothetical protein WISP_70828 [Willisornis vidua]
MTRKRLSKECIHFVLDCKGDEWKIEIQKRKTQAFRTFFVGSREEQLSLKLCEESGGYFTPLNGMNIGTFQVTSYLTSPLLWFWCFLYFIHQIGLSYLLQVRSSELENPLLMAKLQTTKATWTTFETMVVKSVIDKPECVCQSYPSAGSRVGSVSAGAVGQVLCDILLLPESVVAPVPPQVWSGQAEQRDRQLSPQGTGETGRGLRLKGPGGGQNSHSSSRDRNGQALVQPWLEYLLLFVSVHIIRNWALPALLRRENESQDESMSELDKNQEPISSRALQERELPLSPACTVTFRSLMFRI